MLRLAAAICVLISGVAHGAPLRIAVATNFAIPLEKLIAAYEHTQRIDVIAGSTGALYAQIRAGAPFHLFLAADSERPRALIESGHAVPGSQVTYAVGRLALWSTRIDGISLAKLKSAEVRRIALANPDLAPYGLAAQQILEHIDPQGGLTRKLVFGQNVAQVHALTATGAVDAGFAALASVIGEPGVVVLPDNWHSPIRQDAVVTKFGTGQAASDFLAYLISERAQQIITRAGYAAAGPAARGAVPPHNQSIPGTASGTSPPDTQAPYPAAPPEA